MKSERWARARSLEDLVGHNKEWPVGLVQLNQTAVLVTIWMGGTVLRKGGTKYSNMSFVIRPCAGTVEHKLRPLPELTGQVNWKDEGGGKGSIAERLVEMTDPGFRSS